MISIDVTITDQGYGDLISSLEMISQRHLPQTTMMLKRCAYVIAKIWKDVALGSEFKGIQLKHPTGRYAKSITVRMVTPYKWFIFSDPRIAPHAAGLEYGTEEKDLKQIVPYGDHGRVARHTGGFHPYAIVPFRWSTPNAQRADVLPQQIYDALMNAIKNGQFRVSSVKRETYKSPNFWGDAVRRHTYNWGDRMKTNWAASVSDNPLLANLDGLVVFNQPSGPVESTAGRNGFMTFRTVSARPPGGDPAKSKARKGWDASWVVPARQGLHITQKVAMASRDPIRKAIGYAIKRDLGI